MLRRVPPPRPRTIARHRGLQAPPAPRRALGIAIAGGPGLASPGSEGGGAPEPASTGEATEP